ncbi:unnamed protein product [Absidia cylindrospora]
MKYYEKAMVVCVVIFCTMVSASRRKRWIGNDDDYWQLSVRYADFTSIGGNTWSFIVDGAPDRLSYQKTHAVKSIGADEEGCFDLSTWAFQIIGKYPNPSQAMVWYHNRAYWCQLDYKLEGDMDGEKFGSNYIGQKMNCKLEPAKNNGVCNWGFPTK